MQQGAGSPGSHWPDRLRPPAPRPLERAPGPLAFLRMLRNGPIESLTREHFERPLVVSRTVLGTVAYLSEPAAIRHVLIGNASNYRRAGFQRQIFATTLGRGLLTAEGREWRTQRRVIGPVFAPSMIDGFADAMIRAGRALAERWGSFRDPCTIDVASEIPRATIYILETTLFRDGLGDDRDQLHKTLMRILDTAGRLDPLDAIGAPDWMPRIGRLLARRPLALLGRTARAVVAERFRRLSRAPDVQPQDLVSVLLRQATGNTSRLDADAIIDNIVTFIAVGSETAASALTWTLYLLALDPHWREMLEAEIDREWAKEEGLDRLIERLPVTRAVIEESMRLYPPVPITTREAIEADHLAGQRIEAGTMIIVAPWLIHRHRLLWQEPDYFEPSRFLPGARERIDRFAYLPFGAGPRACIGASFAMQEMILVLASIVRRFRLDLAPNHRVWPMNHVTLRPRGGLPMILRRRR